MACGFASQRPSDCLEIEVCWFSLIELRAALDVLYCSPLILQLPERTSDDGEENVVPDEPVLASSLLLSQFKTLNVKIPNRGEGMSVVGATGTTVCVLHGAIGGFM